MARLHPQVHLSILSRQIRKLPVEPVPSRQMRPWGLLPGLATDEARLN